MPHTNRCCNPFGKQNHSRVYTNLVRISDQNVKFNEIAGKFVCRSCRTSLYQGKVHVSPIVGLTFKNDPPNPVENFPNEIITTEDNEQEDPNFTCAAVDNEIKIDNINNLLEKFGASPVKIRRVSCPTNKEKVKLAASVDELKKGTDCSARLSRNSEIGGFDKNLEELLVLLNSKNNRTDKIHVLTFIPDSWTIKKIREYFHVSRRMAAAAKKLRKSKGIGSQPERKKGRPIDLNIIEAVQNLYRSDEVSRMTAGVKHITNIGADHREQRRLLSDKIEKLFIYQIKLA